MSVGGGAAGAAGLEGGGAGAAGSVMDQMIKLFEPPGGYTSEREAELHPYFKRPGRGHNHDSCDSCREGGALICCDSCPASFHLQCHDPPLEDEDIPEGDWICIKCYASKPETKKRLASASTVHQSPQKKDNQDSNKYDRDKYKSDKDKVFKAKDNEWKPKKRKEPEAESSRPTRATRLLKQAKYNDNSTEEELSESDVMEPEIKTRSPKKIIVKRRTYLDIYLDHLKLKPRKTCDLFQALLEAANLQNAEEFQLPKHIQVPEKFPYAWKWSTAEQKLRSQRSEDGDTKAKLSLCYVCVKSSRVGPLVQCDFCPCQFHMDCLDPPLAEIPSDVWICPNHVETLLDTKLTSNRLTERIDLWERYATQPIDTHIVKTQFMKKCSRIKRTCSMKATTVAARKRVKVPEFVKRQYARPVSLLPGPGYHRWMDPTQQRLQTHRLSQQQNTDNEQAETFEEEVAHTFQSEDESTKNIVDDEENQKKIADNEESLNKIVDDEKSLEKTDTDEEGPKKIDDEEVLKKIVESDESQAIKESLLTHEVDESSKTINEKEEKDMESSDSKSLEEESEGGIPEDDEISEDKKQFADSVETRDKSEDVEMEEVNKPVKEEPSESQNICEGQTTNIENPASEVLSTTETSVFARSFDLNISRDQQTKTKINVRDAYSQEELEWVSSLVSLQTELLRQKLGEPSAGQEASEGSLECTERLPSQDRFEDLPPGATSPNSSTVSGISYSGKVAAEHQLLEQLQDYLITHSEVDNLDPIVLKYLAAKQINKILPNRTSLLQSNVRSRASLTPVGSRVQPYYMQYRTLDIGTGPDIHLNLRDFGHCNHLSARHATLFYDELSGQYELINYSPYGTRVDECMYNLDTGILALRYKKSGKETASPVVMAAPGSAQNPCYCSPLQEGEGDETEGESGCEGSALLHHGSVIKFGCLEFVFSVAAIHGI